MEAATEKKKRGRPSIDERTGLEIVKFIADTDTRDQSHRAHVNYAYTIAGAEFIKDHKDAIPYADALIHPYRDSYIPNKTGAGVLEQLGRMIDQDGYTEADVLHIAVIAVDALHQGLKVKEVERYIRRGRTKNVWTWEPAAATNNAELAEDELTGILAYLEMLQRNYYDLSSDNDNTAEARSKYRDCSTELLGYTAKIRHILKKKYRS